MVLAGFLLPAANGAKTANDTPPEIWMLAAPHRNVSAPGWERVRTDAGDMWKPNAPWETVVRSVKVIQFAPTSVDRASANDLKEAVADIKRRNIALAIGDGLLIRPDRCRSKTEAYVNQPQLKVESELRVHPDQAVIESWVKFPTRMLPENQPGTLTNVVLQYVRQRETP